MNPASDGEVEALRVEIAHDGFAGTVIGQYVTREGKRGVVVQQDGTRVVHVYGEKWLPVEVQIALNTSETAKLRERVEELENALYRVKDAILSDVNGPAIQCTIFMPAEGCPPHETLIDFIDAVRSTPNQKDRSND